jgi:hypothetical protein
MIVYGRRELIESGTIAFAPLLQQLSDIAAGHGCSNRIIVRIPGGGSSLFRKV